MYPLYWTSSKEGIFMRYSYEYKMKCIKLYRNGEYPETPDGVSKKTFHQKIREWSKQESTSGSESLKHKNQNHKWTPEEKLELISQVIAGQSYRKVAETVPMNTGTLYQWVHKYQTMGYNGLISDKRGRSNKESKMKKKDISPKPLSESEREELIRLRAEIAYIKAENEVIKKEIALREQKQAARLKAKKQRSSKNSGTKDIS